MDEKAKIFWAQFIFQKDAFNKRNKSKILNLVVTVPEALIFHLIKYLYST
jgi:hypothetical protein